MFCTNCGNKIDVGAKFCESCGMNTEAANQAGQAGPQQYDYNQYQEGYQSGYRTMSGYNTGFERFVPGKLRTLLPTVPAVAFIGAYVVCLIVVIVIISAGVRASMYDLSGTYRYDGFFPINELTFRRDGTFTARIDDSGKEHYGRYKKTKDYYDLEYTGGNGGFMTNNMGAMYSLIAIKNRDGSLDVSIIPKVGYYAWLGTYVNFYKVAY